MNISQPNTTINLLGIRVKYVACVELWDVKKNKGTIYKIISLYRQEIEPRHFCTHTDLLTTMRPWGTIIGFCLDYVLHSTLLDPNYNQYNPCLQLWHALSVIALVEQSSHYDDQLFVCDTMRNYKY